MDVGGGMLFASNVIDGLVHQLGGSQLAMQCQQASARDSSKVGIERGSLSSSSSLEILLHSGSAWAKEAILKNRFLHPDQTPDTTIRCPEGQSVVTGPGGEQSDLALQYDYIIHTVPPFYNKTTTTTNNNNNTMPSDLEKTPESLLRQCYLTSLELAEAIAAQTAATRGKVTTDQDLPIVVRVACPLLGAGCRGFPLEVALSVAAASAAEWLQATTTRTTNTNVPENPNNSNNDNSSNNNNNNNNNNPVIVLAFGIPEPVTVNLLAEALQNEMKDTTQ
jgi:O-acetyl-ADP-ribose deacetylase (regulator of RNase III)